MRGRAHGGGHAPPPSAPQAHTPGQRRTAACRARGQRRGTTSAAARGCNPETWKAGILGGRARPRAADRRAAVAITRRLVGTNRCPRLQGRSAVTQDAPACSGLLRVASPARRDEAALLHPAGRRRRGVLDRRLWDRSRTESGEDVLSCPIITMPANELLAAFTTRSSGCR